VWELPGPEGLLGRLHQYEVDFPWVQCAFEPTAAFEPYRLLFRETLRLIEAEDWEGFDQLWEQIEAKGLQLTDTRNDDVINEFLLHIKEDKAWFRY
jgi:hypothetical protein